MTKSKFTESVVEDAALKWFAAIGYSILSGPEIAPEEPKAERGSFEEVVLSGRFKQALKRLNPKVPEEALEEAFRKMTRISSPILEDANHQFHHHLVIARELVQTVRKNTTIDWTVRESVRAKLRIMVKRVLRKHGYPPDKQESATKTVLEQAELLSEQWVTS